MAMSTRKRLFLALSMVLSSAAHADLQPISDTELSEVTGQAFVSIDRQYHPDPNENTSYTRVNLGMDIEIQTNPASIDIITLQKMTLIYNALENGWTIKKQNEVYKFTKNHQGAKEIFLDSYLRRFMMENIDLNSILEQKND